MSGTEIETVIKRRRGDRKRRYCSDCKKIIRIGQRFVQLAEQPGKYDWKHDFCAGMAGEMKTCPVCFMITVDCTC